MTDIQSRGNTMIAEDGDPSRCFEHIRGTIGIGYVDEYGFIENGIEGRAHGTSLRIVLEPPTVDR